MPQNKVSNTITHVTLNSINGVVDKVHEVSHPLFPFKKIFIEKEKEFFCGLQDS